MLRKNALQALRPATRSTVPLGRRRHLPLDEDIRLKAEALLGESLSDVRIIISPEVERLGARAFTSGSNIYVAPQEYTASPERWLRLLGHELAHVVQQRQGRVPSSYGYGVEVVNDQSLEREADVFSHKLQQAWAEQRKERKGDNRHPPPAPSTGVAPYRPGATILRMMTQYREVDSREFTCGSMPMLTRNVMTCVAIVLHAPEQHKGCLGHIDTDFCERPEDRFTWLTKAVSCMMNALGSTKAPELYAYGGVGWFKKEKFLAHLQEEGLKVSPQLIDGTPIHDSCVIYDPSASPAVNIAKIGPESIYERAVSYEDDERYNDHQDRFYLFQVFFEQERLELVMCGD